MEQVELAVRPDIDCIFNARINRIPNVRLRELKVKIDQEIPECTSKRTSKQTDQEMNEDFSEKEIIVKLNLLTWLDYKLNQLTEAKIRNEQVLSLSENKDITALIGRVRISGQICENNELDIYKEITDRSSEEAKLESRAQLAYCYCRLGGMDLLNRSIALLVDVVNKVPNNIFWKLILGVAHYNAWATSDDRTKDEEVAHLKDAAMYLTQVIKISNNTAFKRQAYGRMLHIKIFFTQNKPISLGENEICRKTFKELIDDILKIAENDAETLSMLGESLRRDGDVDTAIELLEKSVKENEISKTYHFLGKCYATKRKNGFTKAKKSYEKSIELSETNYAAICDFGNFLMRHKLYEEGLNQFRLLTENSLLVVRYHFLKHLRNAYTLSAVCIIKKHKTGRVFLGDEERKKW